MNIDLPKPEPGQDMRQFPWMKWYRAILRGCHLTVTPPLTMTQSMSGTVIGLGRVAEPFYAVFDGPDTSSGNPMFAYRTLKSRGGIWSMDDNGGTQAHLTVGIATDFLVTITAHMGNNSGSIATGTQAWMEKYNGASWDIVPLSLLDFPDIPANGELLLEKTFFVTTTAGGIYRVNCSGGSVSFLLSATGGGAGSLWTWQQLL